MVVKKTSRKPSKKNTTKKDIVRNAKSVKSEFSPIKQTKSLSQTPLHRKKPAHKVYRPTTGIAVIALIVNFIIPGLGTIIGGKIKAGILQLILAIIGALLSIASWTTSTIIYTIAWIWALISSIRILTFSK